MAHGWGQLVMDMDMDMDTGKKIKLPSLAIVGWEKCKEKVLRGAHPNAG